MPGTPEQTKWDDDSRTVIVHDKKPIATHWNKGSDTRFRHLVRSNVCASGPKRCYP